ncbi:MAG: TetR/AcrR family transcriptional regulator [Pelagimonas sp.]|uniref:TetR/AcrR family transcriptional regulator n=1 Tax=Pelagimonas sp. TaxID=2073170 RepID=UPI003D6AA0F4
MKTETKTDDARVRAILTAALKTFAQYGYRKTSMEDLARAAGMSRPALYQHFRNKEDVACNLVRGYFSETVGKVRAALSEPGSPEQVLERAFRAKLDGMDELLKSPHGEELLALGHAVSAGDVAEGMACLEQGFADWLQAQEQIGAVRFEGAALDVARVIVATLDGIKKPPFDRLEEDLVQLAKLIGRGLAC